VYVGASSIFRGLSVLSRSRLLRGVFLVVVGGRCTYLPAFSLLSGFYVGGFALRGLFGSQGKHAEQPTSLAPGIFLRQGYPLLAAAPVPSGFPYNHRFANLDCGWRSPLSLLFALFHLALPYS
jgi:hypothetical protein